VPLAPGSVTILMADSDGSGTVWYFAYGSNLETATLCGRREVEVLRAVPVRAPGWRLVFDKPTLIDTGHSVANIVAESAAEALGVVYAVTEPNLAHVELTEGVPFGNYRRVSVFVEPLTAGALPGPTRALSLSSDRRTPALRPSDRYMNIVITGAIEHGLPPEHVAFLRGVPSQEESAEAKRIRPLIDAALRRRS
jgi:hypothetical protein